MLMTWDVKLSRRTAKHIKGLPKAIQERLELLVQRIRQEGPEQDWAPNYGKIRGTKDCHHCHLKKGRPTYVAVWKVIDMKAKEVEVTYAGTHEKADYKRFC